MQTRRKLTRLPRVEVTEASDVLLLVQVAGGCLQAADCLHLSVIVKGLIVRKRGRSVGTFIQLVQLVGLESLYSHLFTYIYIYILYIYIYYIYIYIYTGLEFSQKWVGGQQCPYFSSKSRGPTQKVGAMQQMHI